jgi:hypothetical protein
LQALPPWQVRLQNWLSPLHCVVSHTWRVLQLNVQVSAEQEAPVQPPFVQSNVHDFPPMHAAFSQKVPLHVMAQVPPSGQLKRLLVGHVPFEESHA